MRRRISQMDIVKTCLMFERENSRHTFLHMLHCETAPLCQVWRVEGRQILPDEWLLEALPVYGTVLYPRALLVHSR